jgi:CheY-like chemotaxis protein
MLSGEKYEFRSSTSVADALKIIEQEPFDAYVLDYRLRDGNGLVVAERIREPQLRSEIGRQSSAYRTAPSGPIRLGKILTQGKPWAMLSWPFEPRQACALYRLKACTGKAGRLNYNRRRPGVSDYPSVQVCSRLSEYHLELAHPRSS